MKEDYQFNINNAYFKIANIDSEKEYTIYTDGSYIRIGDESFSCVGGIILEKETNNKIGEFFRPLKTKDDFKQHFIPNFEKIAIDTALKVAKKFHINKVNIFNDSLSDISKFFLNTNVSWIPRAKNLGDQVVKYAKEEWKKINDNTLNKIKSRQNLFNINNKNNEIHMCFFKYSGLYYLIAFNNDKDYTIINHIKSYKPNNFEDIELITKILESEFINNTSFHLNKQLFLRLKKYVNGDSQIKFFDCYEKFFNLIESKSNNISISSRTQIINLKKKQILKYLGY